MKLLIIVGVATALSSNLTPVLASSTLDQKYIVETPYNTYAGIGAADFSQTFTAGVSGTLDHVSILVERSTADIFSNLIFDVRKTLNGSPVEDDQSPLFTRTIARNEFSTTAAFFSIDVSAAQIQIKPGEMYAITLRAELNYPTGTNAISYWWMGKTWYHSAQDPYPFGKNYVRSPYLGYFTWNSSASRDLGFQTFVNTAAVPEPPPAVLLISALAVISLTLKCAKWRRASGREA